MQAVCNAPRSSPRARERCQAAGRMCTICARSKCDRTWRACAFEIEGREVWCTACAPPCRSKYVSRSCGLTASQSHRLERAVLVLYAQWQCGVRFQFREWAAAAAGDREAAQRETARETQDAKRCKSTHRAGPTATPQQPAAHEAPRGRKHIILQPRREGPSQHAVTV